MQRFEGSEEVEIQVYSLLPDRDQESVSRTPAAVVNISPDATFEDLKTEIYLLSQVQLLLN